MKSLKLFSKKNMRHASAMLDVYILNITMTLAAFLIFTVIINYNFSRQAREYNLNYNLSAVKGIENLICEQKEQFMNLIKDAYASSRDSTHIFEYMESWSGEPIEQARTRATLTNFLWSSYNAGFSSLSIYSAVDDTIYSVIQGRMESFPGGSSMFKVMMDVYGDIYPHIEIIPSLLGGTYNDYSAYGMVYCIRDMSSYENIGAIQADYKTRDMDELLEQSYPSVMGEFLIVSESGDVIYDSSDQWYGSPYPYCEQIFGNVSDNGPVTLGGEQYYINSLGGGLSFYPDLHVIGLVSKNEMYGGVKKTLSYMIEIMVAVILFLCIAMYLNIYGKATVLRSIHRAMKKARQGELDVYVETNGKHRNELTDIADSFNEMARELKQYIQREYTWKMEQQQYQLMALQAQINPHFLYNSFEAIRMKAMIDGEDEIEEMVLILSKIFRNAAKGDGILRIGLEVENCESYLRLHKIRFREQLSYTIDIDEEVRKYAIVQHALQVIIENYIVYGFDSSRDDNEIAITGRKRGDWIEFIIRDNSAGLTEQKLEELRGYIKDTNVSEKGHIGLKNVCQRMRIMFGADFEFDVDSLEGEGIMERLYFKACFEEDLKNDIQGSHC